MSLSTTSSEAAFNGSGSTGPFSFGFVFSSNSHISVEKTDALGNITALVEGNGYTLTGAGSLSGGSVTLSTALAVGESLVIYRNVPLTQTTTLPDNGPYFATTHEKTFDRIVMMIQQLNSRLARTLSLAKGVSGDFTLPNSSRTNTVIGFDSNGNPALLPYYSNVVQLSTGSNPAVYEIDSTIQDMTVNLPASGEVTVCKKDSTSHIVTIQPTVGGQLFAGGASTLVLDVGGQAVKLVLIGTTWYIL